MRTRVTYTIDTTTNSIKIAGKSLDIESIRLICNETQKKILCSSMQKDLPTSVTVSGSDTYIVIPTSLCTLASTDKITVEIDDATISAAASQSSVDELRQAFGIIGATEFTELTTSEITTAMASHYASVVARPIVTVTIDSQTYYLRSDKVYGGYCPEMSAAQDSILFTGYGFTELWKRSGSAGSYTYTHYVTTPTAAGDLDIDTLNPAASDYIVTTDPTEESESES